eukprot:3702585-Karenia_brevis.AAC.1
MEHTPGTIPEDVDQWLENLGCALHDYKFLGFFFSPNKAELRRCSYVLPIKFALSGRACCPLPLTSMPRVA